MAAPTPGTVGTPAGIRLDEGFSSKVVFTRNNTVSLWEKTVKPPGIDGGDKVDTTTMRNLIWRTAQSRTLVNLSDATFKCAYDPNVYNTILTDLIQQEGVVTFFYPDGSTLCLYGYLQKFEPDELVEGQQAEATVTIIATNWDPANRVEAGPVLTTVSGT